MQPDLLFVSREHEHLLSGGDNVRGAPDLVVEIPSPATAERDRGYKRALYGRHGVAEYWLVDPAAETIWIHRQRAGVLAVAHTFIPPRERQVDHVDGGEWATVKQASPSRSPPPPSDPPRS